MIRELRYILSVKSARKRLRPVRPRAVIFNVTARCNANCSMCEVHGRQPGADAVDTDSAIRLFSDPLMQGLDILRITGGEPFLRDDLADILVAAARKAAPQVIYITTNGFRTDNIIDAMERLVRLPARVHLQVSLDALTPYHDRMRGVPGAIENVMATLNALRGVHSNGLLHVGVNQMVMAENLDQVVPMREFANRMGFGHNMMLGAKYHEGKNLVGSVGAEPLPFVTQKPISREDLEKYYAVASRLQADSQIASVRRRNIAPILRDLGEAYITEGGRSRLLDKRDRPAPPCTAMFTHFRISAAGDIYACSVLADKPAGNILNNTPTQIWNSEQASSARRCVVDCPGCWVECDLYPSIFYSGDIISWTLHRALRDKHFRRDYLYLPF